MKAHEIEVGDRIRLTLPGVPAWNLPEQVREADVTEDNVEALRTDCLEQIYRGGAKLERIR